MKSAVLAAAYMTMMLSVGGTAIVLELVHWWDELFDDSRWQIPLTAGVLALWVLWAIIFYLYWRKGSHFEQLRSMAQALIVGSLLELLVATGVFVWKTDEDNCWCARGSYTALVFSATVMIWAFGPGLLFLFLREARYRRHS
jgi:hypothetical protein